MSVSNTVYGFESLSSLTLGGVNLRRFSAKGYVEGDASGGTALASWGLDYDALRGLVSPLIVMTPTVISTATLSSPTFVLTVNPTAFDAGAVAVGGTFVGQTWQVSEAPFTNVFPIVRRMTAPADLEKILLRCTADNDDGVDVELHVTGTLLDLAGLPEHMAAQLALSYTLSA